MRTSTEEILALLRTCTLEQRRRVFEELRKEFVIHPLEEELNIRAEIILQSIASRNSYPEAMAKLAEFGLAEYFLYPQINWNSKVVSLQTIAKSLNIGTESLALVDDQLFERKEVTFSLPDVLTIDAADLGGLLDMPEMHPRFITRDSKHRRQMYRDEIKRQTMEKEYTGTKEDFLATLGMDFAIGPARENDLKRAEELTVRTHQLNATGYTYSYEELDRFRTSEDHLLLIAELEDRLGSYGKVGLALVECREDLWTLKLLLMSCRVMSRGVGTILLHHIMRRAKEKGVRLQAEFVPTDRNRMMYITYKFAGFSEAGKRGDGLLLESDLSAIQPVPDYIRVRIVD